MKLITGWIMSAGLVLAGTAANAQVLAPSGAGRSHYTVVSDVGGPYAAMPRQAPMPGYGPTPPVSHVRGPPRPPLAVPRVASRNLAVPMPKASAPHPGEPAPLAARPAPEPAQRSAAAPPPAKPVDAQAAAPAAPAPV